MSLLELNIRKSFFNRCIHTPEIDRIVKKAISNHMKTAWFMLNAFYPGIPLTDHLNLALSSDARWKHSLEQCVIPIIMMFVADQPSVSDEDKELLQLMLMCLYAWHTHTYEHIAFDSTDITNDGGKPDPNNFKFFKADLIPSISQTATPDPRPIRSSQPSDTPL